MTFDAAAFEQSLVAIDDEIYRLRKTMGITSRTKEIGFLSITLEADTQCRFTLNEVQSNPEFSAHTRMAIAASHARICDLGTKVMTSIFSAAPILESQERGDSFMRFGARAAKEPRVNMTLLDIRLGPRGAFCTTHDLAVRVSTMLRRIQNIEAGERRFLFNDCHELCAATPKDAYRLYAAIARPDLFERENISPHTLPSMTELFDPTFFQQVFDDS